MKFKAQGKWRLASSSILPPQISVAQIASAIGEIRLHVNSRSNKIETEGALKILEKYVPFKMPC
jgi:hypothetical protein